MRKKSFKLFVLLLFIGVINFSGFGQNRNLFSFNEIPSAKTEKNSLASVREAEISVDLAGLNKANSKILSFPLFDGKIYQAKQSDSEGFEVRSLENFTWRGKIAEVNGDVTLTFYKGYVAGLIFTDKSVYEIVPKGDKQILIELNQNSFPECAGDVKVEEQNVSKNVVKNGIGVDSGDRTDVLILYTTPVKTSLGGDAQAQTFAQQSIDSANTAYINSKIRMRVRLANAQETAIAEVGALGTELSTVRNDANTAIQRNNFNADLVAMISNSADACGIGYLMGSNLAGNPNNGFTVTSRTCAVGNLSFAHELGHNQGSQHNPENGSNPTFTFSFGHYYDGNYRTVMSYVNPCPSGCTRRPYFSNPNVLFNSLPTGIELRNNARSINETADAIANYRYSGSSLTLNNFTNGGIFPRNMTRKLTWSTDNVVGNVKIEYSKNESTNWMTINADTANDGEEIIKIPSGQLWSRGGRLRISSVNSPHISDSSIRNIIVR